MTEALTVADILDLRAYERVREEFRTAVMARKRLRRVAPGADHDPGLRVRRHGAVPGSGDGPGGEDPERRGHPGRARHLQPPAARRCGELSATLFIELTSDGSMREWLPKLVGIERALGMAIGGEVVPSVPEEAHAAALVRDTVTPAVHYLRFGFTRGPGGGLRRPRRGCPRRPAPGLRGAHGPRPDAVRQELLGDLRGTTKPLPIG